MDWGTEINVKACCWFPVSSQQFVFYHKHDHSYPQLDVYYQDHDDKAQTYMLAQAGGLTVDDLQTTM